MIDKQREHSYEYYKQWQENKGRYQNECIAYVLLFGVGLFFVLENLQGIIWGLGIVFIIGALILLFRIIKKWYQMRKAMLDIESMIREMDAHDIEINTENNSISFTILSTFKDEQFEKLERELENKGIKMRLERQSVSENNTENVKFDSSDTDNIKRKSTDIGYINRNQQKNTGKTNQKGTDNNQYFYGMECLICGHKYYANGTDIWQRKCPACQGGKA